MSAHTTSISNQSFHTLYSVETRNLFLILAHPGGALMCCKKSCALNYLSVSNFLSFSGSVLWKRGWFLQHGLWWNWLVFFSGFVSHIQKSSDFQKVSDVRLLLFCSANDSVWFLIFQEELCENYGIEIDGSSAGALQVRYIFSLFPYQELWCLSGA